jgi:hypothetical protein
MVTYIDAVHPLVDVYDGFLVHSRSAGGAPLSQAPQPDVAVPSPSPVRDDLAAPVLVFQTETDVSFSNLNARQPDSDRQRPREVQERHASTTLGSRSGWPTSVTVRRGGAGIDAPDQSAVALFKCATVNTGPLTTCSTLVHRSNRRWRGSSSDRTPAADDRREPGGVRQRCRQQRGGNIRPQWMRRSRSTISVDGRFLLPVGTTQPLTAP